MKTTKYIASLLVGITLFSCDNFEDINTNPDSVTKVSPKLLATGAILGIMQPSNAKNFINDQLTCKYLGWSERVEGTQYNNFGREGFGGYTSLTNYQLMVTLAEEDATVNENKRNAYRGLAHFLKAYRLLSYTLNVGDIPYEGILEGKLGHLTVAYNTQEDVFKFLISDLDKAHEYFQSANKTAFDGDFIFGGKVEQWNKVSNALELRLLMNLSKKVGKSTIDIKGKFKEVYERNLLLSSNSDNLQLTFSSKEGQLYPFNESQQSYRQYAMISDLVIDALKENEDYRLFYYTNPATGKISAGVSESSWDAYVGIDPSEPLGVLQTLKEKGEYCEYNNRYIEYIPGEPYIRIGYAEQNFILAEAALRGWITGDASEFYKKGIEASMKFVKTHTPNEQKYHHGRQMTDAIIAQTLEKASIQLTGDFEDDLKKIITQKYLAGFMQLPYQSYYDYRRTGYPAFPINPETNQNTNEPTKMPVRWLYPTAEYDYNKANVDAAVQRQFNGSDEVNKLMWILQE